MTRDDPRVVVVLGLGEIGRPIHDILAERYRVIGRDLDPVEVDDPTDVLHVCFPFSRDRFVHQCAEYVEEYRPALVVVHSTVVPGTTREIQRLAGVPTAYSPVRGKHARMRSELLSYTKFVAGVSSGDCARAEAHLMAAGFTTAAFDRPEDLELAKLLETTYFGILVGWAQEAQRYCDALGADFAQVMTFGDEVPFFPPVVYQPGHIGGHCVIPNTYLLDEVRRSPLVDWLRASNDERAEGLSAEGVSTAVRVEPKPRGNLSRADASVLGGDTANRVT